MLALIFGFWQSQAQRRIATAWSEYYFAAASGDADQLAPVYEDYASTPAAGWARQAEADSQLSRGWIRSTSIDSKPMICSKVPAAVTKPSWTRPTIVCCDREPPLVWPRFSNPRAKSKRRSPSTRSYDHGRCDSGHGDRVSATNRVVAGARQPRLLCLVQVIQSSSCRSLNLPTDLGTVPAVPDINFPKLPESPVTPPADPNSGSAIVSPSGTGETTPPPASVPEIKTPEAPAGEAPSVPASDAVVRAKPRRPVVMLAMQVRMDSDSTDPELTLPDPIERRLVTFEVGPEENGQRIDLFLAHKCDGYSRVFLRGVLQDGHVRLNGKPVKPSFKVQIGQVVEIDLPPPPDDGPVAEDIPLTILFEDESLVIINKPAGMVVHPAKGHWSGTLTSALAHHFQQLSDAGGPTDLVSFIVWIGTPAALSPSPRPTRCTSSCRLNSKPEKFPKSTRTIVVGSIDKDRDWIRQPIGHHPYQRDKMAIRSGHESSRDAETMYEVIERFQGYAYLRVMPRTGRTHQIRVHLSHVGIPVLCDRLYAGHSRITRGQLLRKQVLGQPLKPGDDDPLLERQALHAYRLELNHPVTGQPLAFEAPLPPDIQSVLDVLRSTT